MTRELTPRPQAEILAARAFARFIWESLSAPSERRDLILSIIAEAEARASTAPACAGPEGDTV